MRGRQSLIDGGQVISANIRPLDALQSKLFRNDFGAAGGKVFRMFLRAGPVRFERGRPLIRLACRAFVAVRVTA